MTWRALAPCFLGSGGHRAGAMHNKLARGRCFITLLKPVLACLGVQEWQYDKSCRNLMCSRQPAKCTGWGCVLYRGFLHHASDNKVNSSVSQNKCQYLMLLPEDLASLLQLGTLGQQVVLLQPNHGAWAADADVAYSLLSCEALVLDEVAANENASAPQPCLAVDSKCPCACSRIVQQKCAW